MSSDQHIGAGQPHRPTSSSLLESAHQHRVLAVMCAIECGQLLPTLLCEFRNVSVSDVAKYSEQSDGSMGAIGVCADVTLSVTLRSFLRWACCLHVPEQNRAPDRCGS